MAIIFACEQWRHYLQGANHTVTIYTDHKNLIYFTESKTLSGQLVHWWEELSTYDLKILHKPGKENARANALSQQPDYLKGTRPISNAILNIDNKEITINWKVNISANLKTNVS